MHQRCETGEKIHKEWRDAVKTATKETWQDIFHGGYKVYTDHAMTCPQCYEVEMDRVRKYQNIEVRSVPFR